MLNANGKYVLGKGQVYLEPALGNDNPEGERPNATKARLAFEGATEANETASRMAKQYEKGSIQMDSALGWMSQAAKDKQKFRDAVLKIKELALENPLLAGEIRDVLAPVYMMVRDTDDQIDNRKLSCIHGNGCGFACFVDENCPFCRACGIENIRQADQQPAKSRRDDVKQEPEPKRKR